MRKWSEHTSDVCPFCGGHTRIWPSTYAFNFEFMTCPFCSGESQSAFVDMVEFQWTIPDDHDNMMRAEAWEMVRQAVGG